MTHYRLVRFDSRANGLSDWDVAEMTFDHLVDDLELVFDVAGVEQAPILAISQGCAVAAAFAARVPERVSAVVMIGGFPVGRAKRKSKKDQKLARALKEMMTAGWDDDYPSLRDLMADVIVPSASLEDRIRYARDMKDMISPENMGRYRDTVDNLDVTDLLSQVQAPTLVLHCKGDRMQPIEQGRKLAADLPNARLIVYIRSPLRDLMADVIVPSASLEDRIRYARDMKDMISPENMGRYRDTVDNLDVTDLLSQVQAPTLVLHCKGDRMQPIEQGRKLAADLPNARLIVYESNNHVPTENDPCWPLMENEIHTFLKAHT